MIDGQNSYFFNDPRITVIMWFDRKQNKLLERNFKNLDGLFNLIFFIEIFTF